MIKETKEGVVLTIHVQPRASATEYVGLHGDALKFRVASPPVEGAANEALCRHLADQFHVSKGRIVVVSGQGARQKRILLKGIMAQRVRELFLGEAQ